MSNISNYSNIGSTGSTISYAKIGSNAERIQEFAKYLHEMLPVLEKEFDDLESLSQKAPNNIFPIKMGALSAIYNAAGPLYEWYVEKAKKTA